MCGDKWKAQGETAVQGFDNVVQTAETQAETSGGAA